MPKPHAPQTLHCISGMVCIILIQSLLLKASALPSEGEEQTA